MKKALLKKLMLFVTISALAAGLIARAKKPASIDDQAALRGEDEVSDITYIDEEAIALAGEAVPSDTANAIASSLALVNAQRAAAGQTALAWNEGLVQAAQVRATEASVLFSHTRPNGQDWYTVNSDIMWGENLAMLYETGDSVVAAWMASPTHAANILNPAFTSVGVAVYKTGSGDWYWAQEFAY